MVSVSPSVAVSETLAVFELSACARENGVATARTTAQMVDKKRVGLKLFMISTPRLIQVR
jgi:hypothetical protein